jgi:hypothetical protein
MVYKKRKGAAPMVYKKRKGAAPMMYKKRKGAAPMVYRKIMQAVNLLLKSVVYHDLKNRNPTAQSTAKEHMTRSNSRMEQQSYGQLGWTTDIGTTRMDYSHRNN